jgi:hypothetical protein
MKRLFTDFRHWRKVMIPSLFFASAVLISYWTAWIVARDVVASDDTSQYVDFEQAFPLADSWLVFAALLAAIQFWRTRPSALVWTLALGGGGIFLFALDVLYDLQHGIYAQGGPGLIELGINVTTLFASSGLLYFGWHYRRELLAEDRDIRPN